MPRKDPAERLHDIADGRFQLEDALNDPVGAAVGVRPARSRREWAAWIVAALSLGAALWLAARPALDSPSGDPISIPIFPPDKTAFAGAINTTVNVPSFALSPDGRAVVFGAETPGGRPTLWVRSMDRLGPRQLAGTEDAQDPAVVPGQPLDRLLRQRRAEKDSCGRRSGAGHHADSRRLPRWLVGAGRHHSLRPRSRTDSTRQRRGRQTHARDGHRRRQARKARIEIHTCSPTANTFCTRFSAPSRIKNGIYVGSLDGKTKKLLVNLRTNAVYAPPGYLLFVDGSTLFGQRFDAKRLELDGEPFLVAEHVGRNTAFMGAVSTSRTGIIAYADTILQNGRLTWMDRRG